MSYIDADQIYLSFEGLKLFTLSSKSCKLNTKSYPNQTQMEIQETINLRRKMAIETLESTFAKIKAYLRGPELISERLLQPANGVDSQCVAVDQLADNPMTALVQNNRPVNEVVQLMTVYTDSQIRKMEKKKQMDSDFQIHKMNVTVDNQIRVMQAEFDNDPIRKKRRILEEANTDAELEEIAIKKETKRLVLERERMHILDQMDENEKDRKQKKHETEVPISNNADADNDSGSDDDWFTAFPLERLKANILRK